MTLNIRRVIYFAFIGFFLVAAPLVIYYTAGYRWQGFSFSPTSTLVISTIPRSAAIILDGKNLGSTPSTIRSLGTGLHTITLQKTGYHDWTKRLPLYPNRAVFATEIRLWPKSTANIVTGAAGNLFHLNINGTQTIGLATSLTATYAELTNIATAESTKVPLSVSGEVTDIEWSSDSRLILLKGTTATAIINADPTQNIPVAITLPRTARQYHFSDANNKGGYAVADNKLYEWDWDGASATLRQGTTLPPDAIIDDFIVTKAYFFFIYHTQTNRSILSWWPIAENKESGHQNLPANNWRFIDNNEQVAIIGDDQRNRLIINTNQPNTTPKLSLSGVTGLDFNKFTSEITYTLPFELWSYQPLSNEQTLLTRLGDQLANPRLLDNGAHVVFTANRDLRVIERDPRDTRNVWTLASDIDIQNLAATSDSTKLYFNKLNDKANQLWSLDLGPATVGLF